MASRRTDPRVHTQERDQLRRELEEPAPISIAMMPMTEGDLRTLAKATGYSIATIKSLYRVYRAGGLKSAGSAAFQEAFRIGGAGWKSASDKAQKVKAMLSDFHEAVRKLNPGAARPRWPSAEPPAAPASKLRTGRAMSDAEIKAQNNRVVEYAQERIDELGKPAELKSALVRARKASPRAQAEREERAMARRDEALAELKRLRELGVRGDLPGKDDVLARRPVEITEDMADRLAGPTSHRPPRMTEKEVERLASEPGRGYAHHPETAVETPHGGKTAGGPDFGTGDSSFEPGGMAREAGIRQRALTQQRLQQKALKRSLSKPKR